MTTATKPTILIIPGSFSPRRMYSKVASSLNELGFEVQLSDLPSASREPPEPAATLADDANHYQQVITDILATGRNLVILSHSYGGVVASESVRGLTTNNPTGGRLIGLVYLTALIPKVGDSTSSLTTNGGAPEFDFITLKGDYMFMDIEATAKVNFNDLPVEQAVEHAKVFHAHSLPSFLSEVTCAGYEDVKNLAYIHCTLDKILPPFFQQKMIENLSSGGTRQVQVYELESSHCANASKPKEVAELVARAVEAWSF